MQVTTVFFDLTTEHTLFEGHRIQSLQTLFNEGPRVPHHVGVVRAIRFLRVFHRDDQTAKQAIGLR